MLQSWYLLGPVTRFQVVGEHVSYEIAQRSVSAVRTSGETLNPVDEELKVVCAKTVRVIQMKCEVPSKHCYLQGKELRSHLTPTGLLFSTISDDAPSFHEFFPELEELLGKVDFTKLPHRRSINYEGRFNWKTM